MKWRFILITIIGMTVGMTVGTDDMYLDEGYRWVVGV
jgi:hypothetical protein